MRAYLPITPENLHVLLNCGSIRAEYALVVDSVEIQSDAATDEDEEEREFEASWKASVKSREIQGNPAAFGFVLALDLESGQIGATQADEVALLSDISWSQVQSLLVADSAEPELSWFAPQEIATYLPQWLA